MTSRRFVKYISAGHIRNEFIIDRTGKAKNGVLGGSLLYSASALNRWGGPTGLLGVVSEEFSREQIKLLEKHHLDIRGIKTISEKLNPNAFYAYLGDDTCVQDNPVAFYAAHNLPLPRELLDYASSEEHEAAEDKSLVSRFFLDDIPTDYLDSSAAHICPLEISAQLQLITLLQRGSIRTISVQPHTSGMMPEKFEEIAILIKDTAAMITKEANLRSLFKVVTDDLWEMMERLSGYGCNNVVVKNTISGYSIYERNYGKRYRISEYPVKKIDPTGEMDVFCGAFLAGLHETYDPLHALTQAVAAASIKVERTGPFSIEDSLPGLDRARMESLQNKIVQY